MSDLDEALERARQSAKQMRDLALNDEADETDQLIADVELARRPPHSELSEHQESGQRLQAS